MPLPTLAFILQYLNYKKLQHQFKTLVLNQMLNGDESLEKVSILLQTLDKI